MIFTHFRNWTFLSLVFLVPLLFNPWGVDMYEMPKNTVLKLGIGLLGLLWALESLRKKRIKIFLSKRMALVLLFFVVLLGLSWITSERPTMSFWGSYYKQGGVVNMIYYLLLFILSMDFFSAKENRILFLKVLSYSGCVVSIYALAQRIGFDFLPSFVREPQGRLFLAEAVRFF